VERRFGTLPRDTTRSGAGARLEQKTSPGGRLRVNICLRIEEYSHPASNPLGRLFSRKERDILIKGLAVADYDTESRSFLLGKSHKRMAEGIREEIARCQRWKPPLKTGPWRLWFSRNSRVSLRTGQLNAVEP